MQDYRLTELDAGFRVITETLPDVRSISLGYWVGTGSRDEATDQAGISHFLEHLLFKGTERLNASDIAESFDSIGAEINAFTSKEQTVLHCRFLDEHLKRALEVTSEMLLAPVYREIDVEREVVLEEIAMYEDEPQDKVHDIFSQVIFGDHPLGRPVIGDSDVIRDVSRERVGEYHRRHYTPKNIVVAAAGNLEHRQLIDLIEGIEVDCYEEDAPERMPANVSGFKPTAAFVQKDTDQCHVCLGGLGISRSDERRYALGILDTIFGGSVSSRLFQEVRERRGLAYVIYSFTDQFCDTGNVGIYVGTRPENLVEVLDVIASELERLQSDPASVEELDRAKESFKGRFVLSMEMTQARMNRLGRSVIGDLELHTLDEIIAEIDSVDREILMKIANELYEPGRLSAAGIGSGEDIFWKALEPINNSLVGAS